MLANLVPNGIVSYFQGIYHGLTFAIIRCQASTNIGLEDKQIDISVASLPRITLSQKIEISGKYFQTLKCPKTLPIMASPLLN